VVEPAVSPDGIVSVRDGVQVIHAEIVASHHVNEDTFSITSVVFGGEAAAFEGCGGRFH